MSDGDITTMRRVTVAILCVMASFALFASLVVTQPWTPISIHVRAGEMVHTSDGTLLTEGYHILWWQEIIRMPETEVDSTHYRILFLGALVLFAVTFFFNTIAEVVRQRLRTKYSSL